MEGSRREEDDGFPDVSLLPVGSESWRVSKGWRLYQGL